MQGFWGLIASAPSLVHSLHKKARHKQATVGLSVGLSGQSGRVGLGKLYTQYNTDPHQVTHTRQEAAWELLLVVWHTKNIF